MTNEVIAFNGFESRELNTLASTLIQRNKKIRSNLRQAQDLVSDALLRRYENGKDVYDHYDRIMEEVGSQREFANRIGITESMLSNDLRAFRHAKEEYGVESLQDFTKLLSDKGIPLTVKMWEKLPSVLDQPKLATDKRPKPERKLEDLHSQAEEIRSQNEGANPAVFEKAEETLKYIEDITNYLNAQDTYKSGWRSRKYLDFVKSIGWDYITGDSSEQLDPHHTLPDGTSLGPHGKVADVFTIPVQRSTHTQIEQGQLKPSRLEIAEALIRTMSLFIITHLEGD